MKNKAQNNNKNKFLVIISKKVIALYFFIVAVIWITSIRTILTKKECKISENRIF